MMTRRGYEQLAITLAEGYDDICAASNIPSAFARTLNTLAQGLREDNARFDREKFMQAFWDEVNRISSVRKGE